MYHLKMTFFLQSRFMSAAAASTASTASAAASVVGTCPNSVNPTLHNPRTVALFLHNVLRSELPYASFLLAAGGLVLLMFLAYQWICREIDVADAWLRLYKNMTWIAKVLLITRSLSIAYGIVMTMLYCTGVGCTFVLDYHSRYLQYSGTMDLFCMLFWAFYATLCGQVERVRQENIDYVADYVAYALGREKSDDASDDGSDDGSDDASDDGSDDASNDASNDASTDTADDKHATPTATPAQSSDQC